MNSRFIKHFNFKKYFAALLSIFFSSIFVGKTYATGNDYAYAQGVAARFAFLNQGADVAADKGIMAAVSSVSPNGIGSLSLFGAAFTGESKYKTDSQGNRVDLAVTCLVIGVAKSFNIGLGELPIGAFFDSGISSYDGYNDLPASGLGNSDYVGGGLLGYINFKNNFYGEFSSRAGLNQTKFAMDFNKVTTKYDYKALYAGCHLGTGYVFKINSILSLDTYGKYLFTCTFSEKIDGLIKFSDINSQRVRAGTRLGFIFSEYVTAYCGAAWEYETLGTISIENSIDSSPKLKGGSGIGEVGISDSFKDFYFDVSAQCYVGERKGVSLMLRVSFDLFSRIERFLGYSIDKFHSDKIKKFSKNFTMSKKDCLDKTLEIIENLRARVTHKNFNRGYVISFDFAKSFEDCCLDSTEASVFIKEIDPENVTVEVCSDNSILGEKFSVKFFKMLIEKPDDSSKESENKNNA
jgi:hypothetical protein